MSKKKKKKEEVKKPNVYIRYFVFGIATFIFIGVLKLGLDFIGGFSLGVAHSAMIKILFMVVLFLVYVALTKDVLKKRGELYESENCQR